MKYFILPIAALLLIGAGCLAYDGQTVEPVDTSDWVTYTDPTYGFSIQYPSEYQICLSDFCDKPGELETGNQMQFVEIFDGPEEGVGGRTSFPTFNLYPVHEGSYEGCKLADDAGPDQFGRMGIAFALELPDNPSSDYVAPAITEVEPNASFKGNQAYSYLTTEGIEYCSGGWSLADNEGTYQVMYFQQDSQIWRMTLPLSSTFEAIRDSLTFE